MPSPASSLNSTGGGASSGALTHYAQPSTAQSTGLRRFDYLDPESREYHEEVQAERDGLEFDFERRTSGPSSVFLSSHTSHGADVEQAGHVRLPDGGFRGLNAKRDSLNTDAGSVPSVIRRPRDLSSFDANGEESQNPQSQHRNSDMQESSNAQPVRSGMSTHGSSHATPAGTTLSGLRSVGESTKRLLRQGGKHVGKAVKGAKRVYQSISGNRKTGTGNSRGAI
jgi:hypothetical protein